MLSIILDVYLFLMIFGLVRAYGARESFIDEIKQQKPKLEEAFKGKPVKKALAMVLFPPVLFFIGVPFLGILGIKRAIFGKKKSNRAGLD